MNLARYEVHDSEERCHHLRIAVLVDNRIYDCVGFLIVVDCGRS